MRLSALPTCCSNVLTAFWLCGGADRYDLLGLLLLTSSCFYLAGMVLNDVFDAKIDAVERPERPIPSGRITLRTARLLGNLLLIAGILVAKSLESFGGNQAAVAAGLALGFCILLYNGLLKQIPIIGPITMGLCRFFNILMVSLAVGVAWSVYATTVFAYITAVTILSGYEAKSLVVRKLVGIGLSSVILIDAAWCLVFVGVVPTLCVLTLYPVAMGLRRIVPMT